MKLYLLELGRVRTGEPILGYLVQTAGGQNVLIDTGYRPGTLGEEGNPDMAFLQAAPQQLVTVQLRRIGLSPEEITCQIVTHLDPDHAGFLSSFPQAEAIIQRRHLALARASEAARFLLTRPVWGSPDIRYKEVDGDVEILPGIHVVETSGHVTGHQSVLLELPNTGAVLLPIDAMAREHLRSAEERTAGPFDENEEELRRSTRKLIDLADRRKALIIYAHDAEQWAGLRHSPDYYD
ncbi:MAG: N-acyl homoserine lactonase family protein [Acidobacteria bacterium]|nr:N-acyl homoserine lactonase family protein [Acidobacteriota bacterium]